MHQDMQALHAAYLPDLLAALGVAPARALRLAALSVALTPAGGVA